MRHFSRCNCLTGPDLLLHGGRNGGLSGGGVAVGIPEPLKPSPLAGDSVATGMVHPSLDTSHQVMPGSVMFNNVNSFYSSHQSFINHFLSYTVHHPAVRPTSRDPDHSSTTGHLSGGSGGTVTNNSGMRHPSGGSLTGGSGGSSPDDRGHFKQGSAITDRVSGVRNSFEQRQCNSVGSDQPSGSPGSGGAPYRGVVLHPPSPSQVSQKSPFDMTTIGMSKSVCNYTSASAFTSTSGNGRTSGSVISSPYNIKQEPRSPAQASRGSTKTDIRSNISPSPGSPGVTRSGDLSPLPSTSSNNISNVYSQGYSGSLERKIIHNRIHPTGKHNISNNSGGQGFNFPSPTPHNNSHPISPAGAGVGDTSGTPGATGVNNNNNHPRPVSSGKFRYPSGPTGTPTPTPVQSMSPEDSNTTTSNSAMSSREGTPGPGQVKQWCESDQMGAAPNIDISSVQVIIINIFRKNLCKKFY